MLLCRDIFALSSFQTSYCLQMKKIANEVQRNVTSSRGDLHILNSGLYSAKSRKKAADRIRSIFKPDQSTKKNPVTRDCPVERGWEVPFR